MPVRFSQPYRGQPRPKYPKPKKQVRNLIAENNSRILTLTIGILVSILAVSYMISIYKTYHNGIVLVVITIIVIFSLLFIFAILDGFKNINKFRKGYDIDASGESKDNDDNSDKAENNLD